MEHVRKQLEEDGRKRHCNQTDKRTKEAGTKNCKNVQRNMEAGRHFPRLVADKAFFIMYSRKVQKKYIADTKLQERSQEKHMVVRLWVGKATWLRHQSMLVNGYIVGVCKGGLNQANLVSEKKETY